MKGEQAERNARDHQQLDVGGVGEDVRAEREQDRRGCGGAAVSSQPTHEEPREDDRRGKRHQDD